MLIQRKEENDMVNAIFCTGKLYQGTEYREKPLTKTANSVSSITEGKELTWQQKTRSHTCAKSPNMATPYFRFQPTHLPRSFILFFFLIKLKHHFTTTNKRKKVKEKRLDYRCL